jgi:hypothetical protein
VKERVGCCSCLLFPIAKRYSHVNKFIGRNSFRRKLSHLARAESFAAPFDSRLTVVWLFSLSSANECKGNTGAGGCSITETLATSAADAGFRRNESLSDPRLMLPDSVSNYRRIRKSNIGTSRCAGQGQMCRKSQVPVTSRTVHARTAHHGCVRIDAWFIPKKEPL